MTDLSNVFDLPANGPRPVDMEAEIPFGKHAGTAIKDLDPGYVSWLLSGADHWWVDEYRTSLEASRTYIDEEALPEYTLEADQELASQEICHYMDILSGPIHRLQGGAGYGKSFATQDIVINMKRAGYTVRACATSYVATQNIAKDLEPLGVECGTIARMLRLNVEYEGAKENYLPGSATYEVLPEILGHKQLLIVDEYSMVNDTLASILTTNVQLYGGRLLVVGDVYQLPSPDQDWDSALCHVDPVSTLTIPKRYALDSDLFRVEQIARANPYEFQTELFRGSSEVQQLRDLDEMVRRYVEVYKEFPDQQTMMLWFRRDDMVEGNRLIREQLFGKDAPDVCEDENLRVQRTSDYTEYFMCDQSRRVYSGTTMRVVSAESGDRKIYIEAMDKSFTIPVTWIVTDEGHEYAVIFSVTEHKASPDKRGGVEFNAALQEIATWCDERNHWQTYRLFRNCFVQVSYQYASTIHRVQGMSVDNVFTSPTALRRAPAFTAAKLQYVGLTRAKKRLICL